MPKRTKKKNPRSINELKKEAWKWFSRYIRVKDADENGYVKCVTCGHMTEWDKAHAGHFKHASKGNIATYDERNVNPQCRSCNMYKHGSLAEYAVYLEQKHGVGTIVELDQLKAQSPILKHDDYDEIISTHKQKAQEIAVAKGLTASWVKRYSQPSLSDKG